MTSVDTTAAGGLRFRPARFIRDYAVLVLIVVLMVALTFESSSFLTFNNIVNLLNQNAPLATIAIAGTFVVISGGFDLSTASIFAVGSVAAAWVAQETNNSTVALITPLVIGLGLGIINGLLVTMLRIHSFLATLASSLAFGAIAVLITGGSLITVTTPGFTALGRDRWLGIFVPVYILVAATAVMWFVLQRTTLGRHVFAVGGNSEASQLSGIRVNRVKVVVFALSGLASGLAAAMSVSLISSGQPQAGTGLDLQAIAAIILGGTSIYGGVGAVWRSVAGVFLIALIGNGFDLLNFNPQIENLVTGIIILAAVGLAAVGTKR
jgi:ribose transport system permease protein